MIRAGFTLRVTLSDEQSHAARALQRFISDPHPREQYITLLGLAGTGKTTLLAELARQQRRMLLTAFTGKAAAVLRSKFPGAEVTTLHSLLFHYRGLAEDERDPLIKNPIFHPKGESLAHRTVLLDECSTVGRSLAEALLATGARVVAAGDPGQLPPVHDAPFFTEPNLELTQIHRQALGSAIIRQAHAVRETGEYEADGDDFRVIARAEPDDLLAANVLLCWRNRTRCRLNARKRELLSLTGALRAGEPLMCLRNVHELGIFNGESYRLVRDHSEGDPAIALTSETGREIFVPGATIEGFDPEFNERRYDDSWVAFAPAYAVTVNKAQGSEWPSVLLLDEADRDRSRYLYTGISRASERVTVLRWRS